MQSLIQDLRYAIRQLMKSPGFTAIAVLSLALAIGANTTIFSFANQMLFVTLGVPHPEQLRMLTLRGDEHMLIHALGTDGSIGARENEVDGFAYPVYRELRQRNSVLNDIVAVSDTPGVNITVDGEPRARTAELVSGNFYNQMQLRPELGRGILPSDDGPLGSGSVAVLSDRLWHSAFGGSRDVLGKTIRVNMTPVTIVGVNPPAYTGATAGSPSAPEIFLPLSMVPILQPQKGEMDPTGPNLWWLQLFARAKPGIKDDVAQTALDVAFNAAVHASIAVDKDDTVPHLVLKDGSRGDTYELSQVVKPLYLLLGFSGLVLLLACANIANLMLARATARQREMGVRFALGATRARVVRQLLTESLLLSVLGGAGGLLLGYTGRNLVPWLMSTGWSSGELAVPFDWRVFAFSAAITLCTGILFGLAPAWRASRAQLNATLKESSQSASRRRRTLSGKAIVGFQVALSTLLVVSAAFFVRTIYNLNTVSPGFDAHDLTLFSISLPQSRYPAPLDLSAYHRIEEAVAAVPGVEGVTAASMPLVAGWMMQMNLHIDGNDSQALKKSAASNLAMRDAVGGTFFSTMSIPILAGRALNEQDTETSPKVAVVNEALARKFFPNANPIGRRVRTSDDPKDPAPWVEIVGICGNTHYQNLREDLLPIYFEPYRQQKELGTATYAVRSSLSPNRLLPSLRRTLQQIDPDLPITEVRTQQQEIDSTMQQERMFASLTAGFGVLALALACVGVYGIMAYTVSQRTNEIGIRLALGAAREHVRAMVLRETVWLAGAGVVIGLALTMALTHLIASMLYGLKPYDPATLGGSMLVLLLVAVLAGFIPAHRASRVDPIEALRNE